MANSSSSVSVSGGGLRSHVGSAVAGWYWVVLALGFTVAFAVPLFGALHIGGLIRLPWSSDKPAVPQELFTNPYVIATQGSYVALEGAETANPSKTAPFLFTVWLNLKKLPAPGEQLVLLSKYEGSPLPNNGYAIALKRDEASLRPMVFWGDETTTGKWYDFPEIEISAREWFLIGLSFSQQKYLGLYFGDPKAAGDPLKLLGGYELGTPVVPSSSAPLILGAAVERHFRGLIGAFGVFNGKLPGETRAVLSAMMKSPSTLTEPLATLPHVVWVPDASASDESTPHEEFEVVYATNSGVRRNGKGARKKNLTSRNQRASDGKKI